MFVQPGRPADLDHRSADHPTECIVEFGIGGVVGGDVLQIPGRRVEAEPGPGVDVAEADRARPGDDASDRRTLDEHAGGEVGHVASEGIGRTRRGRDPPHRVRAWRTRR